MGFAVGLERAAVLNLGWLGLCVAGGDSSSLIAARDIVERRPLLSP